jgi:[acyl-carrier-protein] S-malonyltransferase
VDATGRKDPARIKANLIAQLTAPVRWTQSMRNMLGAGALNVIECGPGNVLQGLFKKVSKEVVTSAA